MHHAPLDRLAREIAGVASRRTLIGVLLGAASGVPRADNGALAKKHKKKVTLCLAGQTITASSKKKKKKFIKQGATLGSCPPPGCTATCAGKTCGDNGCGGICGTCEPEGLCQSGQCVCKPDRQCGAICCAEEIACFAEGCACENALCRCNGERTFCSTPDFTQCCAVGDTCDPVAACTTDTDTCSTENDVCTVGGAFCGDGFCLCTTSAAGAPFCADFDLLEDCPETSACDDDTGCGAGETCANVPCCSETGDTFFGVCLPACAVPRGARAVTQDHSRMRRRLTRTLHLDISKPRLPQ